MKARSSRARSSSRCEISVPSGSGSGSLAHGGVHRARAAAVPGAGTRWSAAPLGVGASLRARHCRFAALPARMQRRMCGARAGLSATCGCRLGDAAAVIGAIAAGRRGDAAGTTSALRRGGFAGGRMSVGCVATLCAAASRSAGRFRPQFMRCCSRRSPARAVRETGAPWRAPGRSSGRWSRRAWAGVSGPSTTSAMPKITRISEKSIPNMSARHRSVRPGQGAALRRAEPSSVRWRLRSWATGNLGKLGVLVPPVPGSAWPRLLGFLAIVHGLLEAAEGRAQVRAERLELLAAEHQQHDQQDEQQMSWARKDPWHAPVDHGGRVRPISHHRTFGTAQLNAVAGHNLALMPLSTPGACRRSLIGDNLLH